MHRRSPLRGWGVGLHPFCFVVRFFYPSLPPIFSLILVQSYRFLACGLACPVTHLSTLQAFFRRASTGNRLRKSFCFLRMKRYIVETFIKRTLPIQRTRAVSKFHSPSSFDDGKRAESTKHDFRCPICRSAIGQTNYLICASRRQLTFPFCC